MGKIIEPKAFLQQLQTGAQSALVISPSDLLKIEPLNVGVPLPVAFNESDFYQNLKEAVSNYNADAALSGGLSVDFDDLHTKYCEYIAALKSFCE